MLVVHTPDVDPIVAEVEDSAFLARPNSEIVVPTSGNYSRTAQ